jgi:hypothetical protein
VDRDEAIERLRSVGVRASKRDWSLGETIAIPVGEPRDGGGITYYKDVLYLYPKASGSWGLLDVLSGNDRASYPDLASAVRGVLYYLSGAGRQ